MSLKRIEKVFLQAVQGMFSVLDELIDDLL